MPVQLQFPDDSSKPQGLTGTLVEDMGGGRWLVDANNSEGRKPRLGRRWLIEEQWLGGLPAPGAGPRGSRGEPRPRYFITGTWNDWELLEMVWDGEHSRWTCEVCIGWTGYESFQILREGDWAQCVHPDMKDAGPASPSWELCGPDDRGYGLNWTLPGVEEGTVYEVRLHAREDGAVEALSWAQIEPCATPEEQPRAQPKEMPGARYFVAGTWNAWSPEQMLWDPERLCLRSTVQVGRDGHESFQIWLEGDGKRCLHPDMKDAGANKHSWRVCGPDDQGHGKNWVIGKESGMGAYYDVRLFLRGSAGIPAVEWVQLGGPSSRATGSRAAGAGGPPPKSRFFVVGKSNDWIPSQMFWDSGRGCLRSSVQIGPGGSESFQILADADWRRRIHPSVKDAGSDVTCWELCGPDDQGHGKDWVIGRGGAQGARYELRLYLQDDGRAALVEWAQTAADVRFGDSPQEHSKQDEDEQEAAWRADYAQPVRFESAEHAASPRFAVGDPAALQYFKDHGYAIFSEVLEPAEVERARDLLWEFVESHTDGKVRRDYAVSWDSEEWPGDSGNSLFNVEGVGQSPLMWHVRTRPKVLGAFAQIWGLDRPEDLLVSFDRASAFRPPSLEPTWRTRGSWFHVDQNGISTGSGFHCAQGLVALYDNDTSTGGLAVLPGSQHHHRELFKRWPLLRRNDFFILPRADPLLSGDQALLARILRVRAGDLAIWDSRCVHCNVPALHLFDEFPLDEALAHTGISEIGAPLLREFTTVSDACWAFNHHSAKGSLPGLLGDLGVEAQHIPCVTEALRVWAKDLAAELQGAGKAGKGGPALLSRAVAYICATPRSHATPEIRRRRVRAALMGGTTTHWPHKIVGLHTCASRRFLESIRKLPPVALRLIGCEGDTQEAMLDDLYMAWKEVRDEDVGAAGPDGE